MEEEIHILGRHVIGQVEIHGQIPFRSPVGEVAQVYPVILLAISNDIADMEISMQAGFGGRKAVQGLQQPCTQGLGNAGGFLYPGTDNILHIGEDIGIGRCLVNLFAQKGELDAQRFQLLRLLGNDTGERTFVRNDLIFAAEAFTVRDQAERLGAGNAGLIHSLGYQEFMFDGLGVLTIDEHLGQRASVLFGISKGLTALPGLDVIFQIDFLVIAHTTNIFSDAKLIIFNEFFHSARISHRHAIGRDILGDNAAGESVPEVVQLLLRHTFIQESRFTSGYPLFSIVQR